jgi:hypothetical protein
LTLPLQSARAAGAMARRDRTESIFAIELQCCEMVV